MKKIIFIITIISLHTILMAGPAPGLYLENNTDGSFGIGYMIVFIILFITYLIIEHYIRKFKK